MNDSDRIRFYEDGRTENSTKQVRLLLPITIYERLKQEGARRNLTSSTVVRLILKDHLPKRCEIQEKKVRARQEKKHQYVATNFYVPASLLQRLELYSYSQGKSKNLICVELLDKHLPCSNGEMLCREEKIRMESEIRERMERNRKLFFELTNHQGGDS